MILNQMCPNWSYLIHALSSRFALCHDSCLCESVEVCESVKVLLDSRTFVEIRALSRFVAIRASFGRLLAKKRWEGAQKHFKGPGLVVWKYESIKVWKGGMGSMKVSKYESIKVWKGGMGGI